MNHLTLIKNRIHLCEQAFDRVAGSVKLLAVSKNKSVSQIKELYHAGQLAFGENYLQEALEKITALADTAIEWHFIGPIQTNKTRKIAEHFTWVHSVENDKIAKRLNDQRPSTLPPLNICIQVNISAEPQKSGIEPAALFALAQTCKALPRLHLRGLMAIPAHTTDFEKQRATYHDMFLLWQMLCQQGFTFDTLSMGMSDDFVAAIAEGSTLVRIGRALYA